MIHRTRKQSTASYGLPFGSYTDEPKDAPVCPTCNLVQPLAGSCCE